MRATPADDSDFDEPVDAPTRPKRKRTDADSDLRDPTEYKDAKKAKRRAARAAKKASAQAEEDNIDETHQLNTAIGRMDQALLADHTFRQFRRFETKLSDLELEDNRVPQAAFLDTSSWDKARTLESLPDFIDHFAGKRREDLAKAPSIKGAPHTLVICSSAIRAADATRALRCYQGTDTVVSKLFAKHIKLNEAIQTTQKSRISVGVGTPQRILDLLDNAALSVDSIERVVIDGSWCGAKKRTLFEQADAIGPLMRLLARPSVKARLTRGGAGRLSIIVY